MMNKRDLIKFYAYLDNNGYLKEEYKNFQSMRNTIVNFIKALPNGEASRVSENEQAKEVCPHLEVNRIKDMSGHDRCGTCWQLIKTG